MIRKILGILIASSVLAGAAMAYAIFITDDQDTIDNSVLSAADVIVIDISTTPTTALWNIPDMDPGELTSACFVLANDGEDAALITMSVSNTNTTLSDEVVVAVQLAPDDFTPYLNSDGTATGAFTGALPSYGPAPLTGLTLGGAAFIVNAGAQRPFEQYCLSLVIPDTIPDFASIAGQTNTTVLTFDSTLAP
jgi:hypothetical protein